MDYINFKSAYDEFENWNNIYLNDGITGAAGDDVLVFNTDDRVNSPSHYTSGKKEVIDVIEDAIKTAPSNVEGMLQGQVLKYLLRMWLKDNPIEDARKAQWYLNRLVDKMY